ncbi:non-ribosomal peptide synthetase [Streptomyces apocyni]|uniref:non-ribosomal peptide synthetase n=1 Tax=Streptomyces apocyni TaxID=2654677 RepID=UPI0012E9F951|nr:non-ribosomal peptide synthetase [Streptomyces apocyni]
MAERPLPAPGNAAVADLREGVADIWRKTLGLSEVRDEHHFFDEGGDSLLAVDAATLLRELTGTELALDILYDYPEFGALTTLLAGTDGISAPEPRALTGPEERLWITEQLHHGSAVYHIAVRYRFDGALDAARLRAALDALAVEHEALRRGFVRPGLAVAAAKVSVPLRWVDGRNIPETSVSELLDTEARTPFDLARPPLLRALLLDQGDSGSQLLLTVHHLVCDGISLSLLESELQRLYEGGRKGPSDDGADGHGREAASSTGEVKPEPGSALDFWHTALADAPRGLSLPHDLPRPARLGTAGGAHRVTLTDEQLAPVFAFAEQERLSDFMTWLAAYVVGLAAVTGDRDLVVAVPLSAREREQRDEVGMFVDVLPLRFTLPPGTTARTLVRQVRRVVTQALAHRRIPFQTLVEEFWPSGERARAPLAQTSLTYLDTSWCGLRLGGHWAEREQLGTGTAKYEVLWQVTKRARGTVCELEYAADLFTAEHAAAVHERLLTAVRDAFAAPDSELPGPITPTTATGFTGVHDRVRRHAEVRPGATAVQHGADTISYGELDRRARAVAAGLRTAGFVRGGVVAVPMERGIAAVTACLGVLYAGGAYLPVDTAQPAGRTRDIVSAAAATAAVVSDEGAAGMLAGVVPVHRLDELLATDPQLCEPVPLTGADVAYVMCTSGSTGQPKAVIVPHRAVNRLVPDAEFVTFSPGDRVAHVSNPAFDAATFEVWGALAGGGVLVVADRDVLLSPARMRAFLAEQRITVMFLTVTLFNQLVDFAPDAFRHLRVLLFGGEKQDVRRLERLFGEHPPAQVVNGYGPTENTTFSTTHAVTPQDIAAGVIPLGRPLPRSTAYALDESGKPVPPGGTGELYVGGDGLAHGYLGAPELTAAAFVPDPFATEPGQRLYRTGDQVRVGPDGGYAYVGRFDDQVKVRGHRVELAEVEWAVRRQAGVADAVVLSRRTPDGAEILAFVSAGARMEGTEPLNAASLSTALRAQLPPYMLPTVVVVDRVPVTPNGKADRTALLDTLSQTRRENNAPDVAQDTGRQPQEPHPDEVDETVAALWRKVLDTERALPGDDFLNLGGHSLKAMRLLALLDEELGADVELVDFLENPTLGGLAALVREQLGEEDTARPRRGRTS